MSNSAPTVGELCKARVVTDEQLQAAIDAHLAETDAHPITVVYNPRSRRHGRWPPMGEKGRR